MELVSFAKDVLQGVAEWTASYRIGQTVLRHLDRALWVVEKSARWAVPPPLDRDEAPPELVRPLPWVFFLAVLIALRVSRQALSLLNLALGRPPLRAADMVTYMQGKRRYLRALKYQGNMLRRARAAARRPRQPWHAGLHALLDLALCLRPRSAAAPAPHEMLVVNHGKRSSPQAGEAPSNDTMERLIEKMMTDLDAESDADSSFTLTNAKSNETIDSGSENDTVIDHSKEPAAPSEGPETEAESKDPGAGNKNPEAENNDPETENKDPEAENKDPEAENKDPEAESQKQDGETPLTSSSESEVIPSTPEKYSTPEKGSPVLETKESLSDPLPEEAKPTSAKEQTMQFIQNEISSQCARKSPKKIANGRIKRDLSKRKAVPEVRVRAADGSHAGGKENGGEGN